MSPPYARFSKLDESKQAAILGAARQEFVAHGYDGASLNRLIGEAGISKGSFYYYFEDKLDLFVTVIEQVANPVALIERSGIMAGEEPEAFWEGLERMIELGLEVTRASPDLPELGQAFATLSPQALSSPRVLAFMGEMSAHMARMLEHGQAIGAVREDIPVSVLIELWMGLDRVLNRWGLEQMKANNEEELVHVWEVSVDLFKRMFSAGEFGK